MLCNNVAIVNVPSYVSMPALLCLPCAVRLPLDSMTVSYHFAKLASKIL
jgi:hypothetical protein